jgi:hypothetical protein
LDKSSTPWVSADLSFELEMCGWETSVVKWQMILKMEMAKHWNVRTGHLGHISVQSNSYFTPRKEVYHVPFFSVVVLSILSNGVSWTRICIVSWLFWNKGLLYSQNGLFLSQGIWFIVFYDEFMDVFGATWLLVMLWATP